MTNINNLETKIEKYLSGQVSNEEMDAMIQWLQEEEAHRELFAMRKQVWVENNADEKFDEYKINDGKKHVELKIQNIELETRLIRVNRLNNMLKYAAFFLLVLGLSFTIYFYSYKEKSDQYVGLLGNEIEVPYGAKSKIILPDGSEVWINAGSKVKYGADFGVHSRKLQLEGEAYFDVKKNDKIPFIVETDLFDIKVYGTAFNVKSYLDDCTAETTLDRGSVSIIRKNKPNEVMNLLPKQKVVIPRMIALKDAKTNPVAGGQSLTQEDDSDNFFELKDNVDTKVVTAWKDNRLVFDQEQLGDLAKRLERQYNVTISFSEEKLKFYRYSAAIKEMPIEQVLQAISLITPIQYKIEGASITLSKNRNF